MCSNKKKHCKKHSKKHSKKKCKKCPPGPPGPAGPAIDERILLTPINRVNYWLNDEGLAVQTQSGPNVAGAFNGGGTGTKSLVELNDLSLRGRLLSSFERLDVRLRRVRPETGGTLWLYVNFQIQAVAGPTWSGPPGPDRIVVGNIPINPTLSFVTYSFDRDDSSIWSAAGAPGLGLPQNGVGNASLNVVTPNTAAFFFGFTGDGGLPAGTQTSPILLVTSDSGSTAPRTLIIESFSVIFNDGSDPITISFTGA